MIKINEAVIVEGKYDKIKLDSILDATIIETNGFSIFEDKEKLELIRKAAKNNGIIILTDSDSAGFKIRGFLNGAIKEGNITNLYIPDVFGKEKRKPDFSKEKKLGVEGIEKRIIEKLFSNLGVKSKSEPQITKLDLYEDGYIGSEQSSERRYMLLKKLDLPEHISTNRLIEIINLLSLKSEYISATKEIKSIKKDLG
jgi:ribonuclease M5